MKKDDALFSAVAEGGTLKDIHQPHQRNIETINGVFPEVVGVVEKLIVDKFLFSVDVLFTIRHDHVVNALKRVPELHEGFL